MSGPLSPAEITETAAWIASVQLPNGMIPWFPGGHADPWNHTESAMALVLAGRRRDADRAFEWLASAQLPDGTWCRYH
ncbi:MAG: prenyltransferase, partial [Acidimicrobiales bacterium]